MPQINTIPYPVNLILDDIVFFCYVTLYKQSNKLKNVEHSTHHYPLLYRVCLNMIFYDQYKTFKLCTQSEPRNVESLWLVM